MDKIHIRDLTASCVIGVNPEERNARRNVTINLTLHTDTAIPAESDRIADAVDYRTVRDSVVALIEQSSFSLIEALAEAIAAECLSDQRVVAVEVTLDKPGALRQARSVAVEIKRPAEVPG